MTCTETSTATEEEEDQTETESSEDTPYNTTDDRACVASSIVVLVSVSLRHVRFILTKATAEMVNFVLHMHVLDENRMTHTFVRNTLSYGWIKE